MSFSRILVANRGEIAVRVIRTCHDLGIESVLGASDADLQSVPARLADAVVRIGPAAAARSYLDAQAIVRAALGVGAEAIHPGYGFLAESAELAAACTAAGLVFIGPTEDQLRALGDKLEARRHAVAAGLPVLPGGAVSSGPDALDMAASLDWPLLVKAVGGGGGRGIRIVREPGHLEPSLELAMAEAEASFGNPAVYLEQYVEHARHIEVQVLGDGNEVVHLGDRECSVQRRYQKLLEEAPAPGLDDTLRDGMRAAAVALGRRLGYRGLGTVEFLFDADRQAFYFLEMNARIQVEHPVTEAVTGIDLVAEQIEVAEGRGLRLRQQDVTLDGHAIECRINAEDGARGYLPSPGRVTVARFPAGPGIRVDTHIEPGVDVPPWYDSMLAKLIVHAADRPAAVAAMRAALRACRIEGVATNVALHRRICSDPEFLDGCVDTGYFGRLEGAGPEVAHA